MSKDPGEGKAQAAGQARKPSGASQPGPGGEYSGLEAFAHRPQPSKAERAEIERLQKIEAAKEAERNRPALDPNSQSPIAWLRGDPGRPGRWYLRWWALLIWTLLVLGGLVTTVAYLAPADQVEQVREHPANQSQSTNP